MGRLIDADALIHELNNSHYPGAPYVDAGISIAIGKVCDAPTIEQEPHWIPCSERLPEDWVPVLVTLKKAERLPAWIKAKPENYYHFVDADVCENGVWSVNKKNVIAWMPLPDPWKGEQHETKNKSGTD